MVTIKAALSWNQKYLHIAPKDFPDEYKCLERDGSNIENDLEETVRIIKSNTSIESLFLFYFCEANVVKYQPLFQGISQNKSIEIIHIKHCNVCKELSGALFGTKISKLCFDRCNFTVDIFAVASLMKEHLSHISFKTCMFMRNEDDKPTKRTKVEYCEKEVQREVLCCYDIHLKELRVSHDDMSYDISNEESKQNEENPVDIFAVASLMKEHLSHISFKTCMFMRNEDDKPTKRTKVEYCEKEVQREVLYRYDIRLRELCVSDDMSYDVSNEESKQNEESLIRFASTLPNLPLRKLDLSEIYINDNAARALSYGISQNKTIEILELANLATEDATNVMISGLDLTSSLKKLELWDEFDENITDNVMLSLADALANDSTLEELEFIICTRVTSNGWVELSRALGSPRSSLKKLRLLETSIDDSVIVAFGNDLSRNTAFEVLNINESRPITSESWLAFSRLFGSNLSNLREINVSDNGIENDVIVAFINELSENENSLLKRFIIRSEEDYVGIDPPIDYTSVIWDQLKNLLCNTSNIDATWSSNHTLCSLGGFDQDSDDNDSDTIFESVMPQEVSDILKMNEGEDKKLVARKKIIKHHFCGDIDLNALIGSDQKLLPCKISWFGRDALGLSMVYSILRKLPDLFQK